MMNTTMPAVTHRRRLLGALLLGTLTATAAYAPSAAAAARPTPGLAPGDTRDGADNFYRSDKVTVRKVTFQNQYKMKVVGSLFVPKDLARGARVETQRRKDPIGGQPPRVQLPGFYRALAARTGNESLVRPRGTVREKPKRAAR